MLATFTFLIYQKIKEKSFLYYFLYASTLNLFLIVNFLINTNNEKLDIQNYFVLYILNWILQYTFYLIYIQFIRSFFNFKTVNPKLNQFISYFIKGMALVYIGFTLLNCFVFSNTAADISYYFEKFTIFFFAPVFVVFTTYVLYQASKIDIPTKYYIIIGSAGYAFLNLGSMYYSTHSIVHIALFIFLIAVFVKFLLFAIALGIRVYQIFLEKNNYHIQLVAQLEANKKLAEHNNTILTEKVESYTKKEIELELKNSVDSLKVNIRATTR